MGIQDGIRLSTRKICLGSLQRTRRNCIQFQTIHTNGSTASYAGTMPKMNGIEATKRVRALEAGSGERVPTINGKYRLWF